MTTASGISQSSRARLFDESVRQAHPEIHDLLDALPCGVYACDPTGRITYYNEHSVRLWGREPKLNDDADLFCGSLRLFSPEGLPIAHNKCLLALALRNNKKYAGHEIIIQRPDGERATVLAYASPIHDALGAVVGAVNVLIDITSQKQTAGALHKREEWFSRIFQNTLNGIAIKNWDGPFHQCNAAYCKILGYSEEELRQSDFVSHIHPDDREAYLAQIQRLKSRDVHCFETESRYLHKDGHPVWVHKSVSILPDEDGQPAHLLTAVTDISERRLAEAAIRESEEQYKALVQVSSSIVWSTGPNGLPDEESPAWLEFTGQNAEESKGLGWLDVVHVDDRDRVRQTVMAAVAAKSPIEVEYRVRHHSGEWRWMVVRGAPLFDSEGNVRKWIGMNTDVTKNKEAEEHIRMHQAELAHASRRDMVGEMGSAIAHELDQPLMVILGGAEACARLLRRQQGIDIELIKALDRVVGQAERAGKMVNRLKSFLRDRQPRRSTVSISAVVRDAVELARLDRTGKGVEIILDLEPKIEPLPLDSIQISQVIVNLLRNAFDAVAGCDTQRQKVIVKTRMIGRRIVEVSVRDFGKGCPNHQIERMFTPFFTTKQDQLGVGLSLCRALIKAHGGRLWAEANPDYGLTFRLTLPISGESVI